MIYLAIDPQGEYILRNEDGRKILVQTDEDIARIAEDYGYHNAADVSIDDVLIPFLDDIVANEITLNDPGYF